MVSEVLFIVDNGNGMRLCKLLMQVIGTFGVFILMLSDGAHDSGRYMNRIERPTSTKLHKYTSGDISIAESDTVTPQSILIHNCA